MSQAAGYFVKRPLRDEAGTTLIETLVSLALMLIVSAGVMEGIVRLSHVQSLVFSRSAMHDGVRSATELLQQEVGQAGSVSLPAGTQLTGAVTVVGVATVGVSSTAGMFVGEKLVVDVGATEETVEVTAISAGTPGKFTGNFTMTHNASSPVSVRGGFASGIVPCASASACPGFVRGRRGLRQRFDRLSAQALRRHQRQRGDGLRRVHSATSTPGCSIGTRSRMPS